VGERDPGDDEDRARVGRVPHVAVETGGDETMFWMHGQVEGEELAEGAETVQADVSAEYDGEDADDEERGDMNLGGLGKWTDEGVCGDWERRGKGGDGAEEMYYFEEGTPPDNVLMNLNAKMSEVC
jgi:hypothetical protein